jgi:hypothetical protein
MTSMKERILWTVAASIAAAAAIAACSGGEARGRRDIRGPATPNAGGGAQAGGGAAKKIDPASSGTITGTIKWEGAKPNRERLDVSGSPDCLKTSKETIYEEKIVVNDNNTVCFAYVAIDTADTYETPAEAGLVDQIGCHYVPHVFGVMAGQTLKIKSSDPTSHNAHYIPTNFPENEENIAMVGIGTKERKFPGPDRVKFKCDVHPWMNAWLHVSTHPFFAVTGADGTYTIKNVPAGTHKLVVKQEKLGDQTATITVEAGKTTNQDFTYKQ